MLAATVLGGLVVIVPLSVWTHANARPQGPNAPVPAEAPDVDPAKVALGERVFSDFRLSGDGSVSCRSCHLTQAGGADPRRFSVSAFGKVRPVNSPSIFNVRYLESGLNWTGRTPTLERQVEGAIANPDTMASSWSKVLEILSADADLAQRFRTIYGGEAAVNQKNVIDAIVHYERSLVTRSRFDDWLEGDERALTSIEKQGYEKFKALGCASCHSGVAVGGNSFARLGVFGDYFKDRAARGGGDYIEFDKGKFLQTGNPDDLHVFRVSPLRNVALTAPYFHDGSVMTLDEAILLMGRYQLGRELPVEDRHLIAAFLHALTGKKLDTRQ